MLLTRIKALVKFLQKGFLVFMRRIIVLYAIMPLYEANVW